MVGVLCRNERRLATGAITTFPFAGYSAEPYLWWMHAESSENDSILRSVPPHGAHLPGRR